MKIDFIRSNAPAPPGALESFQSKVGGLPEDYLEFLQEQNGGLPQRCVFDGGVVAEFYGLGLKPCFDLEWMMETLRWRVGEDRLIIGDDPGGHKILLDLSPSYRGRVLFWDHETGEEVPVADSFRGFLEGLEEEEE